MQCLERIACKKNRIDIMKHGERLFVRKTYRYSDDFRNECLIYDLIRHAGFYHSNILFVGQNEVCLEYIPGYTALEVFEKRERQTDSLEPLDYMLLENLADWLTEFYAFMESKCCKSIVLKDIHLRNFIYSSECMTIGGEKNTFSCRVAGIDFESCRGGEYENDIGTLLAYIIYYDDKFTPYKIGAASYLFEVLSTRMGLDRTKICRYLSIAAQKIMRRRQRKKYRCRSTGEELL